MVGIAQVEPPHGIGGLLPFFTKIPESRISEYLSLENNGLSPCGDVYYTETTRALNGGSRRMFRGGGHFDDFSDNAVIDYVLTAQPVHNPQRSTGFKQHTVFVLSRF